MVQAAVADAGVCAVSMRNFEAPVTTTLAASKTILLPVLVTDTWLLPLRLIVPPAVALIALVPPSSMNCVFPPFTSAVIVSAASSMEIADSSGSPRTARPAAIDGVNLKRNVASSAVLLNSYHVAFHENGDLPRFVFVVKYGKKFVRDEPVNVIVFEVAEPFTRTFRPEHGTRSISPSRWISTRAGVIDAEQRR